MEFWNASCLIYGSRSYMLLQTELESHISKTMFLVVFLSLEEIIDL